MGGFVLLGSLAIGTVLVAGERYFADNVMMWFVASDPSVEMWRIVIVTGLFGLAFAREYFDNIYLRAAWSLTAVVLLWGGSQYFLDHTEYFFDTMFMLTAGISFALAALQPAPEPIVIPRPFEALLPSAIMTYYAQLRWPGERLLQMRYIDDVKDGSHRLMLQRAP